MGQGGGALRQEQQYHKYNIYYFYSYFFKYGSVSLIASSNFLNLLRKDLDRSISKPAIFPR